MNTYIARRLILLIALVFYTTIVAADEEAAAAQTTDRVENDITEKPETREENWYGTLERFNKHPIQVKYRIKRQASGATNAVLIINKENFALDDFTRGELDNEAGKFVRFRFKPGGIEEVECLLTLGDSESEGYSGLCPPNAAFNTTGVRRLTMHRALDETETGNTESKESTGRTGSNESTESTETGDSSTP